jgi:hypothetical protein
MPAAEAIIQKWWKSHHTFVSFLMKGGQMSLRDENAYVKANTKPISNVSGKIGCSFVF